MLDQKLELVTIAVPTTPCRSGVQKYRPRHTCSRETRCVTHAEAADHPDLARKQKGSEVYSRAHRGASIAIWIKETRH